MPHQRFLLVSWKFSMGNRAPSAATNSWSRARIHLPPRFTTQTLIEIAGRFGIQVRVDSRPEAVVQDLLIELSSGKHSSHRLYEALVILCDKKVRIESDTLLMKIVHELTILNGKSEQQGLGPMNIFCTPANVITSIEKDFFGDEFVLVDIESHETSPEPKKRSSSMLTHTSRKSTSESNEATAAAAHSLKVQHHLEDMFSHACQNSHVLIQPSNIIVLGQTGAGKTSTIHHLQFKPLPENPSSTDLIEVNQDLFWQHPRTHALQTVTKSDEVDSLSKAVLANSSLTPSLPFYSTPQDTQLKPSSFPAQDVPDILEKVRTKFCLETTKADLRRRGSVCCRQKPLCLYQFIDCGGMPFFRNLLPQFFPSTTTLFLLVHKLTDKLFARAEIRVLRNGKMVHFQQIPSSNLDEIISWISIAHSCSASCDDSIKQNTFIVGTHFDKLLDLCFNDEVFAREAAMMATEHICRQVVEEPAGTVIDPDPVFLDNLQAGKSQSSEMSKLREKLQSFSHSKEPVSVPVQWASLIVHIRDMARNGKNVLTLAEYFKIAASYQLDEKNALDALKKIEEMCLVFRMPAKSYLSHFIFINMQWFFNALARVLNPPSSYSKNGTFFQHWQSLQNSGFMSSQLHSYIISRAPEAANLPKNWISDMLQHLCLLTELPFPEKKQEYFSPILLPPFVDKEAAVKDPFLPSKQIAPVYLRPVCGCLPPGFLARLFTILARSPEISLQHCISQLSATFRFSPTKELKDSYFVKISEGSGAIKIELCSESLKNTAYLKICEITYPVINAVLMGCREMANVWIHTPLFELETTDSSFSPLLALECRDSGCLLQRNVISHLTHIHLNQPNKKDLYTQCSLNKRRQHLNDLHASQSVWLWGFVKEKSRLKNAMVTAIIGDSSHEFSSEESSLSRNSCPAVSRVLHSDQRKPLPAVFSLDSVWRKQKRKHHLSSQESDSQTTEDLQSPVSVATSSTSPMYLLDRYLDNNTFYRYLDLQIRVDLFQHGLLTDDHMQQIILSLHDDAFTAALVPNGKRNALKILVGALNYLGNRGVMGLIVVLRRYTETESSDSCYRTVLEVLQMDSDYDYIKESWLRSLTVFDQDNFM